MQDTRTTPMSVIYNERMQADGVESFSPSAGKPAQVVESWRVLGFPLELIAPTAATRDDLARAHDPSYVADVLALRTSNGFGNYDPGVAASLPWTTGAMLSAARRALSQRTAVCAPVSGFHHASWYRGGGFCTFNGLMVTALALRAEGLARRVAILDCDEHFGDGTTAILRHLGDPPWVHHFTAGAHFHSPSQASAFFARLATEIRTLEADVVLYQAGADPHIDDPLGGWLTTEQLRERDARVFEGLAARKIPVAWNLAGGYQRDHHGGISPVLAIHANTAREHLRVYCGALPT